MDQSEIRSGMNFRVESDRWKKIRVSKEDTIAQSEQSNNHGTESTSEYRHTEMMRVSSGRESVIQSVEEDFTRKIGFEALENKFG